MWPRAAAWHPIAVAAFACGGRVSGLVSSIQGVASGWIGPAIFGSGTLARPVGAGGRGRLWQRRSMRRRRPVSVLLVSGFLLAGCSHSDTSAVGTVGTANSGSVGSAVGAVSY